MAFFDEVPIRAEAAELFDLYQRMMQISMGGLYSMKLKQEYLDKLTRIIELQKIMYFRAKYSEEDDAFEFIQHLKKCSTMLGYDGDIDEVFLSMEADLLKAQQALNQSS
jgi:hypothetical protein|tara:strand:+ start:274 stop:600 length:327 start_codon:yes stop_codon:yes gene_type:complete